MTNISKALWSVESAKAAKAVDFGYLNAIHYMAPHEIAGVGNLCPWASASCKAICLGYHTGQASMVADSANVESKNNVRKSRDTKARQYMTERERYMAELYKQADKVVKKAAKLGLKAAFRFNGSTDIVKGAVDMAKRYPNTPINEYTKSLRFALANARGEHPANLTVAFSRTEENEAQCDIVLAAGGRVAVVFADELPATWRGWEVVDGDKHDLLHLQPRGKVLGLKAKGAAKRDQSGFVVR